MESVLALMQCVALVFEGDVKDLYFARPRTTSYELWCVMFSSPSCNFKCAHVLNLVHIARILLKHSTRAFSNLALGLYLTLLIRRLV